MLKHINRCFTSVIYNILSIPNIPFIEHVLIDQALPVSKSALNS
jgi:hypothetical protein